MHFHLTEILTVLQLTEWFEEVLRLSDLDPDDAKAETYLLEEEPENDGQSSLQVVHHLKAGEHSISYDTGFPTELERWGQHVPEFTVTFKFSCNEDEAAEVGLLYNAHGDEWQISYDIQYHDYTEDPPTHIASVIQFLNGLSGFGQVPTRPTADWDVIEDIDCGTDGAKNIIRNLVHFTTFKQTN